MTVTGTRPHVLVNEISLVNFDVSVCINVFHVSQTFRDEHEKVIKLRI